MPVNEPNENKEYPAQTDIKKWNVYQRIHGIMAELRIIQMTGRLQFKQGGAGKPVATHDDVTKAVYPMLVKFRVAVVPSLKSYEQNGNRTEIVETMRYVNIDDPKDFFEGDFLGYGVDSGDKGPGKATSYATKYAHLKTFVLETSEDADNENTTHSPAITPEDAQVIRDKSRAKDIPNNELQNKVWNITGDDRLRSLNMEQLKEVLDWIDKWQPAPPESEHKEPPAGDAPEVPKETPPAEKTDPPAPEEGVSGGASEAEEAAAIPADTAGGGGPSEDEPRVSYSESAQVSSAGKEAGMTREQFKQVILDHFKVDATKDLPAAAFKEALVKIDTWAEWKGNKDRI